MGPLRTAAAAALVACALGLAAAAPATATPYGYLSDPTDQLAVPGQVATTEITPEGDLYTGWAELVFRYGPRLARWRQPTRTLYAGRYPVLTSSLSAAGVRYTIQVFADPVAGVPVDFVRVTARNTGRRRALAAFGTALCWAASSRSRFRRPVVPKRSGLQDQPGARFDRRWRYAVGRGMVTRNGRLMLVFPRAPRGVRRATHVRLHHGRATPATLFGAIDYRMRLAPGRSVQLDFAMPVVPPGAGSAAARSIRGASAAAHLRSDLASWRAALSPAFGLTVPEGKVRDAFYASLVHILEARYRTRSGQWVQAVNDLNYHAFWLRDTAVIAQALDLAGLHQPALQDVEYFDSWQYTGGLFQSRPHQMDGLGQALWGIGEHVRRTGDLAFARAQLPRVEEAMRWLEEARARDRLHLVPASDPHDDEFVRGHLAGDDFWAIAGADAAAAMARALGRKGFATRWAADRDALAAATLKAARAAAARTRDGAIPPALDARGGYDWGNLWAAYPYPVFAPGDPAVTATIRHVRRRFAEGIATYGRTAGLHGYLGFRVFETELERGAQRPVVAGLYSELAHTTATHAGFESGMQPWSNRSEGANLVPHGWFAAELVALVRNMLVRERANGIQLMAAVPRTWLQPGRRVGVAGAPTTLGAVSYTLAARAGGATLSWSASVPAGTPVWWTVPADARGVRVNGRPAGAGSLVALPSTSGSARIDWTLPRGGPSFRAATAALAAGYRRHHRRPPAGA